MNKKKINNNKIKKNKMMKIIIKEIQEEENVQDMMKMKILKIDSQNLI